MTFAEKFWARVNKDGPTVRPEMGPCWIWTGPINERTGGYGTTKREDGRTESAHRVAFSLEHGEIGAGLHVCHRCDNRTCVRPAHLFRGTAADNIHDMIAKGRNYRGGYPGEKNGRAKLSASDAEQIRAEYARGGTTIAALGTRHGVCAATISHLIGGRNWKSLGAGSVRLGSAAGERSAQAKLTARDVREIRSSAEPPRALALRFSVRRSTISKIIRRERWAALPDEEPTAPEPSRIVLP
jgi:transposase-like protein